MIRVHPQCPRPALVSSATFAVTAAQRTSGLTPADTRMSMCSRFLATLGSGTRGIDSEGPMPAGSRSHAPSSGLASGSPRAVSHSWMLVYGGGGGLSSYPSANFQNSATRDGVRAVQRQADPDAHRALSCRAAPSPTNGGRQMLAEAKVIWRCGPCGRS